MAKRKPDFHAQYKLWLPNMTTEGDGGVIGCIVMMFSFLPRDKREAVLDRITTEHAARCKKEADAAERLNEAKRNG